MQHVIIGNGIAAISAIESIRENDKRSKITVISDEPQSNYSRPLISYFLGRQVSLDKIGFRGKDFYKKNKAILISDKKAMKLDFKSKQVILSDKRKIAFDKLLLATGGLPIIPEIKGINSRGVFTFTKLEEARDIEKYIHANKVKKAVILGGGLIGLKATEAAIRLGIKVTIVEMADRILSANFDKKASGIIEKALEKTGCQLVTDNTVAEIKGENKKVKEVILKNNRKIPTKLVIIAIGVRPNIELVKRAPIRTNKGILVNSHMQTNIENIYAAGDCCEAKNSLLNTNRPIAIWPASAKQGKIAGLNMAGIGKGYEGSFPMNSVELCGIPTVSIGESYPEGENYQILEYYDPEKSIYKKIVVKNNKIIGAIFIGDIERAGIYTGIIRDKIDITDFKEHLLKEDFGLISLPMDYRKHLVAGKGVII